MEAKKTKKHLSLAAEAHYFHGLSLMLMIFVVIIFLTFSALFGSMYYETKMMRLQMENIYRGLSTELTK